MEKESQIEIRWAVPEDALGIITVVYKTWLETYPNKEIGITREDVEDSYKDSFTEENIRGLQNKIKNLPEQEMRIVAVSGNNIVGVLAIVKNENNNQLKTMYVLPEFQGNGVGTSLWNEAKKFCDLRQDTIVQTVTYNKNAIEFYKKLGFVDTGKRLNNSMWRIKRTGFIMPEMELVIRAVEK